MKAVATWALTLALLVGAWFIAAGTPESDAAEHPFTIDATIGERATGRDLDVTVTAARIADAVADPAGWQAEGTWVVFDLEAAARMSATARISGATLVIGDLTYRASERPASFFQQTLVAGVAQTGSIAFEIPAAARDEQAQLRLSLAADARSDSQVVIALDLATLPTLAEATLIETGWAHR